jgi:hypothetical protein
MIIYNNQGQVLSDVLEAGNTLAVYVSGSAIVEINGVVQSISNNRVFGPYRSNRRFSVTHVSGSVGFDELESLIDVDFGVFAKHAIDLSGRALGIINPNTGELIPFGNYADGVPNVTLTNAIGTTETQFSFVTIKGGDLRPDSQIVIHLSATKAGSTSGDLRLRFGPASGSYATATAFGGQGGLTNQVFTNHLAEIWNNGTLNSQLASPAAIGSGLGSTTNAIVSGSVDTALDWNIYFGWQYTVAPAGGDSVTLRKFRVEIKN